MGDPQDLNPEVNPLMDIDPLIHAPARLMVMNYLYLVDSLDFVYLKRVTGLSWGNLIHTFDQVGGCGLCKYNKDFPG